jgi:hypothetical protein
MSAALARFRSRFRIGGTARNREQAGASANNRQPKPVHRAEEPNIPEPKRRVGEAAASNTLLPMYNGGRPIDNCQESKHVSDPGVRPLLLEAEEADQREQILLLHLLLLPPTPERKYRWIKIFSLFPPFVPNGLASIKARPLPDGTY